jgi:hypothetical protein
MMARKSWREGVLFMVLAVSDTSLRHFPARSCHYTLTFAGRKLDDRHLAVVLAHSAAFFSRHDRFLADHRFVLAVYRSTLATEDVLLANDWCLALDDDADSPRIRGGMATPWRKMAIIILYEAHHAGVLARFGSSMAMHVATIASPCAISRDAGQSNHSPWSSMNGR